MADKAKLLQVAQKHLSKGNLDKAIKTFTQLVEVDPRDQRLILRLADIQARAGRKKEAIENYEKVAAGYIKQDFTPKAIAVYKTILRLDPELLSAYEKLAGLYKSQGLEAEALAQFENLFKVYERKNDEDKQISVLKLMADMDPENLGFQVRLGETLAKKGRKKEAAEAFAKAASTLSRRGFHDRASQLFEKITALNPDNTAVRRELCAHYLESGQFERARSEIEAILAVEPDDPRMVLLLGRILFQLGKRKEGEEKIARSIQLFAEGGELDSVMREFLFVAQSHLKNGEVDEAESFYRQITTNAPGETRAIKGLVSVAEARKDRVGQIDSLLLLGRTMQQNGDREGAAKAYRKVADLDPLNEEAAGYLEGGMTEDIIQEQPEEMPEAAAEDDFPAADLVEVVEADLMDIQEMEPIDVTGDETAQELGIIEVEEPESFGMGDLGADADLFQEAVAGDEEEEGGLDIVIEGFDEDDLLADVPDKGEEDTGPAVVEPAQSPDLAEALSQDMSLEELLAEADVYERYGLGDKVAQTLEKAKSMAPDDPVVLERMAAFESGVRPDPGSPEEALAAQGEALESEPVATPVPELDPFEEDLEEADFYASQGLNDEASRIYRSILERDPQHVRASRALASVEDTGRAETAPEPEPVSPAPPEPHFDAESAREVRSKLIVADTAPEDIGEFLDIADDLRSELADEMDAGTGPGSDDSPISFEEIFSQFKKGIEETLGDEEYETHYNLGIAYKDMGLYDDAIREFEAGTRDPALAQDSYSLMAMCYAEKKDFESAVTAIEKALAVSPEGNRTGLYYQLGEVRERQKFWSEAVIAYEQVQQRDPSFEGIAEAVERVKSSMATGILTDEANDLPADGGMDDMLADLIREVEDMAKESSGERDDDPGTRKKDRISYL